MVVAPANITFALEGPPLEEQVAAMTPEEKDFLYKRCNVEEGKNISWFNYCNEDGFRDQVNLGYAWQVSGNCQHCKSQDRITITQHFLFRRNFAPTISGIILH